MPKEIENLFVKSLSLDIKRIADVSALRQERLRAKLEELTEAETGSAANEG